MPSFRITPDAFEIDGQKTFLLMGELHYFRMPRESWETALERLKACGCNAVAYYVPWFVHEPEEGVFDFDGRLDPRNDLRAWIRLTAAAGLIGFLRPGPYVYAETTDLGIPRWFSRAHPEARIQARRDGAYVDGSRVGCVSHQNPAFLAAVETWFDALAAEIRPFTAPRGNVAMVQLCNEIPCDDNDDRNPVNLGIGDPDGPYPSYLKQRYGTVDALNRRYASAFDRLERVEPHQLEQADPERYADERLHYYYEFYYPRYFRRLRDMLVSRGVDACFTHNAYNPQAVSLHTENCRQNGWLHVGIDCYYSLSGRLDMASGTYYCEYGAEYARRFLHGVAWVSEQECGYWNDYPQVYGPELYLWNLWALAGGYRGLNLYLFASGVNRPGMGFYGTGHDWQAPLDEHGRPRAGYEPIRRSLADAVAFAAVLTEENAYDLALGVMDQPGLIWKPLARHSSETYFALRQAGFTPRLTDVIRDDPTPFPALIVASDASMADDVQRKLLRYVENGGCLVIVGLVPVRTPDGEPCDTLAQGLNVLAGEGALEPCEQEKLVLGDTEYYLGTHVQPLTASQEQIVARTPEGRPAAVLAAFGRSRALLLPFGLINVLRTTSDMMRRLLGLLEVEPGVAGARMLRVIPKAGGKAVVLNPAPVPVTETLTVFGRTVTAALAPYAFEIL